MKEMETNEALLTITEPRHNDFQGKSEGWKLTRPFQAGAAAKIVLDTWKKTNERFPSMTMN